MNRIIPLPTFRLTSFRKKHAPKQLITKNDMKQTRIDLFTSRKLLKILIRNIINNIFAKMFGKTYPSSYSINQPQQQQQLAIL